MSEFYLKCDSGFVATVRQDVFSREDHIRLGKQEGLSSPQFVGGDSNLFISWMINHKHLVRTCQVAGRSIW